MGKKKNKEAVPQYSLSLQNNQMLNYDVYYFSPGERILYFLLGFCAGGLVGLIFYGNLFMEDGSLTLLSYISNGVVFAIVGMIAVRFFMPMRRKQLVEKRKETLRLQFREMLSALATAYASGDNTTRAFKSVCSNMESQFGRKSYIALELREIVNGMENNLSVDELLMDFGRRSGQEDILDFANVFQICYVKGGNLKMVVQNSCDMIGEKLAINEEIQTKITSNQMQQNFMTVVPIVMIAFLRFSSSTFAASFATVQGVIAMTVALGIFVGSYMYGRKITDIKG